jgi:hypothetical protein
LIDEAGAFDGLTPLGGGEFLLFSVPLMAQAAGVVTFVANPAEEVGHHLSLFGGSGKVPDELVIYGSAAIEILPDGEPPAISIGDSAIEEGDVGTTNMSFDVILLEPAETEVHVDFATSDGTATAGSDYVASAGTITFLPGETSKSIAVMVLGETLPEADETFRVFLSNPTNATLLNGEAIGTILDDDSLLAGDVDGDGDVDLDDFDIVKVHFGQQGATRGEGDLDGDGVVDLDDFEEVKEHFGQSSTVALVRPLSAVRIGTRMNVSGRELLAIDAAFLAWARRSYDDDDPRDLRVELITGPYGPARL